MLGVTSQRQIRSASSGAVVTVATRCKESQVVVVEVVNVALRQSKSASDDLME